MGKYWQYLAYLLASLLSFFWPFFLIFPIFIFPAALFIRTTRKNFLYSIFLIFSLNTLLFIFYMGLADLIKIPLYDVTIAALNLVAAFGLCFFAAKGKLVKISVPAHAANLRYLLAIYGLFIIAFLVRVVSVAKYPTPILHDPIADAVWTKSILTNHGINYFYSPGLHLVTAFFSKAAGLSIPHALNLVTNSFNAFSVLSWGLVTLLVTRKGFLALAVSALTFIAPVPSMLYVNSGKNALIMAIAFLPLVIFALYRLYKEQSLFNGGLLLITLGSLFLIHYPTFGYAFLVAASIIFLATFPWVADRTSLGKIDSKRVLWLSIAAVLIFLAGWFTLQNKGLADNNALAQPISYSQSLAISPTEIKDAFVNNYKGFAAYSRLYSSYYMPILLVAFLFLFSQKRDKFWLVTMTFVFWVATVPFLVQLFQLNTYDIIRSSGVLLFFQVFVLIVAAAVNNLSSGMKLEMWAKYAYAAIFIVIIGWFSIHQLHQYQDRTASLETVNSYDLAAYKWLNNNNIKGQFLINEAKPAHSNIIFPTDGGMWLPVYTDSSVSDNFADGKQTRDVKLYQIISDLQAGDHVKTDVSQLTHLGYKYYYFDRGVFGPPIDPSLITPYSQLVYGNREVGIYRFN